MPRASARSSAEIVAAGDLAQDLMRHAPGADLGRQPVAASEDDALVGGLPATVACAVVDDEGLVARRIDANAETGKPVVPSNPGFVCGLKGFDGSFGQRGFDQSEAFSGGMDHGWIMGHGKVGEYELPEGASLIACGNRESDRVVVHRMPTPLASRFVHLEIKVDAQDWLARGAANGIGPEVLFSSFCTTNAGRSSTSA